MNRYEIRCTEEQTRKAFALGAPIEIKEKCGKLNNSIILKESEDCYTLAIIPTVEQLIGWLEEHGVTIEAVKCETCWFGRAYNDNDITFFNKGRFVSRKEASLAAIDAALEYLINKNK